MANIKGTVDSLYWSPKEIVKLASDLSSIAEENVQNNILKAYGAFNDLGTSGNWTGKLYNCVAKVMNEKRDTFMIGINILLNQIPESLNEAAGELAAASEDSISGGNYAERFGGDTVAASTYDVNETEDDGQGTLNYQPEQASETKDTIIKFFDDAFNGLTNYKELFDTLKLEVFSSRAGAYDTFSSKVTQTVRDCNDAFEDILQTLIQHMELADEAIKTKDVSAAQKAEEINSIN